MKDQIITALEKFAALLTSQRTVSTIVLVIILLVTGYNIAAPLFGADVLGVPDEETSVAMLADVLGRIAALITALIGVMRLGAGLVNSIEAHPPTLERGVWHNRNNTPMRG